jgi:hypothetical protein
MTTLADFIDWLESALPGTTLPAEAVRQTLLTIADAPVGVPAPTSSESAPLSWRERIWTVPAEVRLGVAEVAEAIGRPKSFVYRHTSAKISDAERLPHLKMNGELVFVVSEIRAWLRDQEERITEDRSGPAPRTLRLSSTS